MAPFFPIAALEKDDEVVAADVATKIQKSIKVLTECASQRLDHIISPAIAEDIVEWLEIIYIEVTGMKAHPAFQQAVYVFFFRIIFLLLRQEVGIAGSLDLHFGDQTDELVGIAKADVLAFAGDDKTVIGMMLRRATHYHCSLLQCL